MGAGIWHKPPLLTKEGQVTFWNAQKDSANTGMSDDSQGELDIVLGKSREMHCRDIVTLGGAVGCRDPKVILEDMRVRGYDGLPKVYFNDLAEELVLRARNEFLKPFTESGMEITFIPGAISDIAVQIPSASRRLPLGVYRSDAFFEDCPTQGYPMAGYDEYLQNHARLGEEFFMSCILGGFARTVSVDKLPFCARRGLMFFILFGNAPDEVSGTPATGAAAKYCSDGNSV